MIDHVRNQTAFIIVTSKNRHGDQKETSRTEALVRFRYITDLDRNQNREGITSDAIIWLSKDADVAEGTIIQVDGSYWRITSIIKARKMDGDIQFLKAFVEKHIL